MITAVLADDEPLIVNGLNKLINWKKLGITIVGSAYDGAEALDLVRKMKPDLLISDINMPKMTGIELLKALNSENSRTKVIFISGFHEFSYAHAAIKFGAVDYLLKPINEQQLESAIIKSVKVNNQTTQKESSEAMYNITSDLPDRGSGFYTVLNCQLSSRVFIESTKSEQDIIYFSAQNLIRDYISNMKDLWVVSKEKHILIFIFHRKEETLSQITKDLTDKICHLINYNLKEEMIIAIGKTVRENNLLNQAYDSSMETMDNRFFCTDGKILHYKNKTIKRYSIDDLYTIQEGIIESIHKSDRKVMNDKLESYFKILKDVTYGNREATISYCLGTVISIKKSLEIIDINLQVLDFDDQTFLKDIHTLVSFYKLSKWISSFLDVIYNELTNIRDNQIHPEIQKIKSYIHENYSKNIKLQDLADIVYLHPNYISGHFKKLTGHTFKDYLTGVRMAEAEKIFLTSDLKVYEIAEKVGFTDYRHFSVVFKKRFGISPRDFRKK